jgi:hypothetical protein
MIWNAGYEMKSIARTSHEMNLNLQTELKRLKVKEVKDAC